MVRDLQLPRELLFRGARVAIGRFRARPSSALFRDSGPIRAHLLVFPRSTVRITQRGAPSLLADPTTVVLYNRHQEYRRQAISPRGDVCEWFAFDEADLVDAIAPFDRAVVDRRTHPFARTHAPSDARTYLRQRALFEHVACASPTLDPLVVEERAMQLLAHVVAGLYDAKTHENTGSRHLELAEAIKERLARTFTQKVALDELASSLSVSVFHLCRVFRLVTGGTVHRHLHALRLRHALERVVDGERDLTALALDVGYASHSHFTSAFRRAFGAPPSAVRGRAKVAAGIVYERD